MARPAAQWRRSGPRDVAGFQTGPDASSAPGSTYSSDAMAPDLSRRFSSFRTRGVASISKEPGSSSPDLDGGRRRGLSGRSSPSPSPAVTPVGASAATGQAIDGAPGGSVALDRGMSFAKRDPQCPTSLLFGDRGLEAFNALTLDDEYILHFYGVRQTEHCERAPGGDSNGGFLHTLVWNVRGREFRASGAGRSKKEAKKEAVKVLLVQLGPVSPLEYEQVTRVIFHTLRGKLSAKQKSIPISRIKHSFEWSFLLDGEPTVVESTGSGSCPPEAEIAAMQDMYIRVQAHVIVAVGSTKAGARAQAAMQMMQAAGFMEHVDDKDRQAAHAVVSLVESKRDASVYVESACRLISETRGAVWRLFLPVVWRAAMAEGNPQGQASAATGETIKTSNDAPKVMPPDLWEQLLDECTVLANCEFGQVRYLAAQYVVVMLMLALEWQAQVATNISDRRAFADLGEEEERIFLRGVQFREDDIVLLRPADSHSFTEEESWQRCFVGVVTSVKGDFSEFMNVNIRVATAEVKKYPEVFNASKFKLYYLTPAVTHDRMVQALRGLTMSKHPAGKSLPPYVFAPEIRYLILHTSEPHAEQVASRGPVPQLSDTDPEQYNPLHQLDELADGDSCKKQRVQPTLLQQVSLQARRQTPSSSRSALDEPYEMLPDGYRLPTDLKLNEAQRQATISAMTNRLTLVQGPPGTGKTHVACAIIDAWRRLNPTKKILAVADSNVAADNLMEGLSLRGIRTVRFGSGSESDLKEESIQDHPRYSEYLRLRESKPAEARTLRMMLYKEAVRRNSVIIATCVGSGHEMLDEVVFERVIIDECAQSIVVLIGDHKQLPPTIVSREASDRGLGVSLLERFVGSGIASIHLLNEQRRMHPTIALFPNMQFYQGKIFSRDVDDCNRPPVAGFLWPSPHSRVCLIDISAGLANMEQSLGTSNEIDPILAILRSVLQCGTIRPAEIGILTPYDAQKARIRFALNDAFDKALSYQIDVDSVDGFQGKEKDLIIFSAVRSNPRGEIGFLKDARRMNVMLTRARRGRIPSTGGHGSLGRSIIPVSRLNDYLEVPTYSYNPVTAGVTRAAGSSVVGGGATPGNSGGGALKTAYMPQGFQADFGSGGSACREDAREALPEPMHEEEEVPEDWEQHL
ncbi:hypothetical protein Emag_003899 [Eimeria magna]